MIELANKTDLLDGEEFEKLKNITKRSNSVFPISSKNNDGIKVFLERVEEKLSQEFLTETLRLSFDKPNYRAKLYDISIVESEKLCEEGYEISVRWSEKRRGEFFHYLNSEKI